VAVRGTVAKGSLQKLDSREGTNGDSIRIVSAAVLAALLVVAAIPTWPQKGKAMFNHFPKSTYEIIGPDGVVRSKVQAIGGGDTITIPDPTVVIQPGDEMRRVLPNGTDEIFEVIDPRFHERFHSIPAHFQVKVRRKGTFPHGTGGNLNITMSGANSRVNIASTDNSTNVASDIKVLNDLRSAITDGVSDQEARDKLLAAVEDLQREHGGSGFLGAYQRFMSIAADHIGVIGPFLPALAGLLPS